MSQALLSGTNFAVAFLLLRRLGTEPYGYYVLVTTGMLLFNILQGAFFQTRFTAEVSSGQGNIADMAGGLIKTRHRLVNVVAVSIFMACLLAALGGLMPWHIAAFFLVGAVSGYLMMWRDFTRGMLLAHHRGTSVVKGDVIFTALLFLLSVVATYLPSPSLMAIAGIGLASLGSAVKMSRDLWAHSPWSRDVKGTPLLELSAIGGWAAFGAAVHWSFSQGYTYIVAGLLSVNAVAAIAATRLLLMPVSLLSTGVNQSLYPLVARWNAQSGLTYAAKKVVLVSASLMALGFAYAVVAWFLQDWFFLTLMRHDVELRGPLLVYWSALVITMLARDQVGCLLIITMRVKPLGYITFFSAMVSLVAIFLLVPVMGTTGALAGVIVGEVLNIAGMLVVLVKEMAAEHRQGCGAAKG